MVHILMRLTWKLIGTSAWLLTLAGITVDFHIFPKDFQWHQHVLHLKQDFIQCVANVVPPWGDVAVGAE